MAQMAQNFYKITTFVLLAVILIGALVAGFLLYGSSRFKAGQQNAFNAIVANVIANGAVSLQNESTTITLVPVQAIDLARQQTILEIINLVQQQGYVSLYNNQSGNVTELILVPYSK
ncbi:MAG: hypothetical protein QXE64_01490 [Candidatus Pacearchaeota archaeon]